MIFFYLVKLTLNTLVMYKPLALFIILAALFSPLGSTALAHGQAKETYPPDPLPVEASKVTGKTFTPFTPEVIKMLQPRAAGGELRAQVQLGMAYEVGEAVEQSYPDAVKWYRMAAERGDQDGQALLGRLYAGGRGVKQDDAAAVSWYRKAAEQGHPGALTQLGIMYMKGRGVLKNEATAVSLYRKAAEGNDPRGQMHLGYAYLNGTGIEPSQEQAISWFRKAAEKQFVPAQTALGLTLQDTGVASNFPEALKWLHEAARQDVRIACFRLGVMYEQGGVGGGVMDFQTAIAWYKKALSLGEERAGLALGRLFENGYGIWVADRARAMHYYSQVAPRSKAARDRLAEMKREDETENARRKEFVSSGCRIVHDTESTTDVTNVCDYNSQGPTNCRDVVTSGTRPVTKTVCTGS